MLSTRGESLADMRMLPGQMAKMYVFEDRKAGANEVGQGSLERRCPTSTGEIRARNATHLC